MTETNKTCLVLGATGETGKALVQSLANDKYFDRIVIVARREVAYPEHPKIQTRVVNFADLSDFKDVFTGVSVAFCCIGTSLSKVSKTEFEFIERDLIVNFAQILKNQNCTHFHIVTGYASNPDSSFFIPRIKGQCESKLEKLQFEKLFIYRPGLLRCQRSEFRPLEYIARLFSNVFDFKNWWSIKVEDLAEVMINVAKTPLDYSSKSVIILEHQKIVSLMNNEH